ncbi:MAG: 4Fe-4S dicluster domain-containing protein [Eubacteriales bacterium]|nr:4Fe-4S dicluster domain-containing protein [Eubacteriales bacterium]
MQELRDRVKALLMDGTVDRVLGWKAGDLPYNPEAAYFETPESLTEFIYDGFCGANLSKMMIEASKLEGRTLVCLKPCDTYSFNQLLTEHHVDRNKAYIIGVACKGKLDIEKIHAFGIKGIRRIRGSEADVASGILQFETIYGEKSCAYADAMLERCHVCKGKEHRIYDELIGESKETKDADRFAQVEQIEAMSPDKRFAYFQKELSKCIRCNACRNVCPACSCRKCVFDSTRFDSAQKANVDSFEEKMFHIIRAFHVAGRCTDCGECSRVCPQGIPLHLFNRKFIKDINAFYGEFQAGEDIDVRGPLVSYALDDRKPGQTAERG